MLASIIINNYNYGRFLRDAIDSALAQTYTEVEVVVVDDGSTDNSPEIIASYADKIIPLLKENAGQASAFNAGFLASSGEIILFLDADDMLLPTAVESAVKLFEDKEVVKVHWSLIEIDEKGNKTGFLKPRENLLEGNWRESVTENGPFNYTNAPTSGNAWSRHFLNRVYPIQECGDKHGADAYLFTLAPVLGRIKKIDVPQAYFRIHGENFSGNKSFHQQLKRDLTRFEHHCNVLSEFLESMGIQVAPAIWKGPSSYYSWLVKLEHIIQDIETHTCAGDVLILVDEGQLGTEIAVGRHVIPFLEKDGKYYGLPPNDDTAIRELKRLRYAGAKWIVFGWTTFWWFDHYKELHRYLLTNYCCVLKNDRTVIFNLIESKE